MEMSLRSLTEKPLGRDLDHGAGVRLVYRDAAMRSGRAEPADRDGKQPILRDLDEVVEQLPAFASGTRIATERGETPVEDLRAGDRIATRDHGLVGLAASGRVALGWRDLGLFPVLRPILIRKGSLGDGLPIRDISVSPNLRLLLQQDAGTDASGAHSVVVGARDLVGREGVEVGDQKSVVYCRLHLARPATVLSEGLWAANFE